MRFDEQLDTSICLPAMDVKADDFSKTENFVEWILKYKPEQAFTICNTAYEEMDISSEVVFVVM